MSLSTPTPVSGSGVNTVIMNFANMQIVSNPSLLISVQAPAQSISAQTLQV